MTGARLGPDDLVLSYYSLPRTTPLDLRLRAAADAGFAGVGLHVADYVSTRSDGVTDAALSRLLTAHGLVLHEVDALALDRLDNLDAAIHMVNEFGAHHLQVQGNRPGTVVEAAAVIGDAATRVAGSGGSVAIEFLGCNNIATAAEALALAELSGQPNVGVQADIWHHVRGANDWAMLASLPLERIMSVQLDDGPLQPDLDDYLDDTRHRRRVPGDGEFDIHRFLEIVHPPGSTLPLSIEVLADDLAALPPHEAAARIAAGARQFLP